jgi:alkyl hydroperoxide reductase subunit AhpC
LEAKTFQNFEKNFLKSRSGKQKMNYESTLDVGDEIPGFDLDSQLGKIFFKDIVEAKWCLLITFPTAFDPVATTDFGLIGKLFDEFESRNILILAAGYETSIVLLLNNEMLK